MFLLQKQLNDSTNGKNWELGLNKFNKEINWLRCIHMEVAELIDSTPWKHWKNINSAPDMNNIHVELVDIWHFLMSYILQETNVPKAVSLVNTHCIYEAAQNIDVNLIIKESEKLSYIALAIETKNMPSFSGIERFIEQFFRACKSAGLSFSWLQKLYIGKNCLNQFRQDNAGGIDENIIDKIFEPYFTTKHKSNGTGIGLYMSKLLVEKHLKGTLKVKNKEFLYMDKIHKGALFEIILPIS
jgi:dimeric dUTPase (all-alpha-NTP-PPase superfamily)